MEEFLDFVCDDKSIILKSDKTDHKSDEPFR